MPLSCSALGSGGRSGRLALLCARACVGSPFAQYRREFILCRFRFISGRSCFGLFLQCGRLILGSSRHLGFWTFEIGGEVAPHLVEQVLHLLRYIGSQVGIPIDGEHVGEGLLGFLLLAQHGEGYSHELVDLHQVRISVVGICQSLCQEVPGAFEIPQAARRLARSGRYAAVVCLGCLIQGDTPHFQLIAAEVTKGVAQVALESEVPVTFGVITAETLDQAIERAGTKAGNKGFDAALAALEMIDLWQNIDAGDDLG